MKQTSPLLNAARYFGAAVVLFFMFTMSSVAIGASLTTDESDYWPGQTVSLSGSGFASGESVTMQVVHADGGDNGSSSAHDPWTVTADGSGNVSASWLVPSDEDEAGATLLATADGQSSGAHAEATFTDAPPYLFVFTTTGLPDGSTVDVSVDYFNNGNHEIVGTLSFLSPGPGVLAAHAETEVSFAYPATIVGIDGNTYALVSTSLSSPQLAGPSTNPPGRTEINAVYELVCSCTPPTNIVVTDIGNDQIQVCWDGQPCAQSYLLEWQWQGHQNWNQTVVTAPDSCGVINLLGHTKYTIRVATVCQDGSVTDYTYTQQLFYSAPCIVPTNLTTTGISATSATFNWTPGTTSRLQKVRYQAIHSSTSTVVPIANATTSSLTVNGLTPSTKYKWNVKGDCLSAWVKFTTSAQKLGQSSGMISDLSVYPNPAAQQFSVEVQTNSQDQAVIIQVVNMVGQVVYVTKEVVSNGHSIVSIDLGSGITDGLYTLRVIAGDQTMDTRIVINKTK